MMKNVSRCIISIFILLGGFSCSQKTYDFTRYLQGSVLKGHLVDGRIIYLIRDNYETDMSGKVLIYSGKAIAKPVYFNTKSNGVIEFYADSVYQGRVQLNKKNPGITILLPDIPALQLTGQQINLDYWDVKPGGQLMCKEYHDTNEFDSIIKIQNIQYGKAPGYYTAQPVDDIAKGDTDAYKRLILKDIRTSVGRPDSLPLLMDMYLPYDTVPTLKPAFVFIHGGGFFLGDKENQLQDTLTNYLVKKGFIFISINYRLGTTVFGTNSVEKVIYVGTQDARAALRYIAHHSESLGIDPARIYLGGSSAGAIIAMNTAFMDNDEIFKSAERRRIRNEYGDINFSGNNLTDIYSIAGVVSMWGAVVDLNIIDGRNADIPVIMFHGTADNIVPIDSGLPYQEEIRSRLYNRISENWKVYGSRSIYNHMSKMNMPVRFFSFEGYGHEPQRNQDGSYNQNMVTIKEESVNFMHRSGKKSVIHIISGNNEVKPTDNISMYKIENINNAKVQWHVDSGLIIERTGNTATVLWYDEDNEGKISACVVDDSGGVEKLELLVKMEK